MFVQIFTKTVFHARKDNKNIMFKHLKNKPPFWQTQFSSWVVVLVFILWNLGLWTQFGGIISKSRLNAHDKIDSGFVARQRSKKEGYVSNHIYILRTLNRLLDFNKCCIFVYYCIPWSPILKFIFCVNLLWFVYRKLSLGAVSET